MAHTRAGRQTQLSLCIAIVCAHTHTHTYTHTLTHTRVLVVVVVKRAAQVKAAAAVDFAAFYKFSTESCALNNQACRTHTYTQAHRDTHVQHSQSKQAKTMKAKE